MPFPNQKKLYLQKQDKSKKGEIDEKVLPLLQLINAHDDYYTTSSCSGRVYLWQGSGKKNEVEWLRVSHEPITEDFLELSITDKKGLIWLRLEPFILHVACKDIKAANHLAELARKIYKKSCILTVSNKIIVEIRGSELVEMPLYDEGKELFSGEKGWLVELLNEKMRNIEKGRAKFLEHIKQELYSIP